MQCGALTSTRAYEAAAGKSTRALGLLKDPNRVFLSSPFLDLKLLPQVIQNRHREQQKFLETYLAATQRIEDMRAIFRAAFREASSSAVSGMGALHVAPANLLKAGEFIATEKPGKAIYRNRLVRVLHLQP